MNIWVLRSSYENDHYTQTHMTEKGDLMGAVEELSEYMYNGFDQDEIEDFESGWPTSYGEDLNCYTREQLRTFLQGWWEALMDSGQPVEFQIYQTQVKP